MKTSAIEEYIKFLKESAMLDEVIANFRLASGDVKPHIGITSNDRNRMRRLMKKKGLQFEEYVEKSIEEIKHNAMLDESIASAQLAMDIIEFKKDTTYLDRKRSRSHTKSKIKLSPDKT